MAAFQATRDFYAPPKASGIRARRTFEPVATRRENRSGCLWFGISFCPRWKKKGSKGKITKYGKKNKGRIFTEINFITCHQQNTVIASQREARQRSNPANTSGGVRAATDSSLDCFAGALRAGSQWRCLKMEEMKIDFRARRLVGASPAARVDTRPSSLYPQIGRRLGKHTSYIKEKNLETC